MSTFKIKDKVRVTEDFEGPDRNMVGKTHTVVRVFESVYPYPIETIDEINRPYLFKEHEIELVEGE